VIVKHNQPCGVACADTLAEAYALALASDELSAFGGIVAVNRPLDEATARALAAQFVECVAAPDFEPAAESVLTSKKNLRLLRTVRQGVTGARRDWMLRQAGPWWLAQREPDGPPPAWRTVTRREPTPGQRAALEFAWKVVAAARSNAIAIARGTQLIGLGAGQTSRIDAVDVGVMKAQRSGHDLRNAVLASDAFFPFADSIEHAAAAGLTAIVQPGGSVRDAEVVDACDRRDMAMVFTGRRAFRH
jgi:phosphoribosylaminoimidazolecarboxamide formyltransferase/IMP cyclohydrolase